MSKLLSRKEHHRSHALKVANIGLAAHRRDDRPFALAILLKSLLHQLVQGIFVTLGCSSSERAASGSHAKSCATNRTLSPTFGFLCVEAVWPASPPLSHLRHCLTAWREHGCIHSVWMAQITSTAAFGMKTAFIREECVLIPLCFLFWLSGRGWDEDIDALPSGSGGYDEKSSCNVESYHVNRHVCTYALVHASFSSRHGIYAAVRCQVSSISCLMAAACAQPQKDNALQRRTPCSHSYRICRLQVDCFRPHRIFHQHAAKISLRIHTREQRPVGSQTAGTRLFTTTSVLPEVQVRHQTNLCIAHILDIYLPLSESACNK